MKDFKIIPSVVELNSFEEFVTEFNLSPKDLIITNEYILSEKDCSVKCKFLYQEKYGAGEPTDEMINIILSDLENVAFDRIIAIGGGTVIDIGKIIAVAWPSAKVDDLYEKMAELTKLHELLIVPTTCGTGSEVTNISIVNRLALGTKQGLVAQGMYADFAILITQFIVSLPYKVFATSSLDALVHAMESYLSPKATTYSRMYSVEAIKLILKGYKKLSEEKGKLNILGKQFLRASNYAGIAFSNAGCGTVHAMSYAFGGKYHVAHGEANYQFLMAVLYFYQATNPNGKIKKLTKLIGKILDTTNPFCDLESLLNCVLERKSMADYGATEDDIEKFAKSTIDNQQRLLSNSYVQMSQEDIALIYKNCL